MTVRNWFAATALALVLTGCGGSSTAPTKPTGEARPKEDGESKKIAEAFAKLSPEDRKIAEAQKYCPTSEHLLGTMDVPVKVTLKDGKVMFVCCDGCQDDILKNPEAAVKKIADLKAKEGK